MWSSALRSGLGLAIDYTICSPSPLQSCLPCPVPLHIPQLYTRSRIVDAAPRPHGKRRRLKKMHSRIDIHSYRQMHDQLRWQWQEKSGCYSTQSFLNAPTLHAAGAKRTSTNASNINFSLSPTVLITTQPGYLHNLISLQPPRSTRSSSVVTLSRPPTISSLKITDRSFRYASPRLWNQLPDSSRQPHYSLVSIHLLIHLSTHLSHHPRSHHPSLLQSFTPRSKHPTIPFSQVLNRLYLYIIAFVIMGLDRTYHAHQFIFSFAF